MLAWRVIISAILIPLLIGIFTLDAWIGEPAWCLLGLLGLLAMRSTWELTELMKERFPRIQPLVLYPGVGMIILGSWFPHLQAAPPTHLDLTPMALALCFAVMLLFMVEAARFREPGGSTETLAMETLILCYVGLLLAMTGQLRWVAGADAGYLVIGSLLMCAKGGDIGAYFVGKRWGRHKMAPILSPKKTWEGAAGAMLGAALGGWIWLTFATGFLMPGTTPCAWPVSVFYGCLIGIAGMVGDVCESLLKRDVGRKDSAALLPGFGGLLDLLDSVLYAGPVALLLWKVLPLATWMS